MSITLIILGITVALSVYALSNAEVFYKLELSPYVVHHKKQWYRLLSHAFIHADYMHLGFNMYVFYQFGKLVERQYAMLTPQSEIMFTVLYIGGALFASIPSLQKHKDNYGYRAVGASGAVAAVLFAFILINPTAPLSFFFIPIRIPAWLIGVGYLAVEYYLDKRKTSNDRIAHDAHYWGAIFGLTFTLLVEPSLFSRFFNQIF